MTPGLLTWLSMQAGHRVLMVVLTVFLALVATAGMASAASPGNGVHVDPGSPAGKQYAFPISAARGETATGHGSSSAVSAPMFGAGVTPSAGAPAASTAAATGVAAHRVYSTRRHSVSTARHHRRRPLNRGTSGPPLALASIGRREQSSAVGSTSWLPLLIGGALVLVVGGGGGFLVRRRL